MHNNLKTAKKNSKNMPIIKKQLEKTKKHAYKYIKYSDEHC